MVVDFDLMDPSSPPCMAAGTLHAWEEPIRHCQCAMWGSIMMRATRPHHAGAGTTHAQGEVDPALLMRDVRVSRGAAAAVVVFDITNADSFAKAKSWVKELQRMGNPNMIMSLAGNKADLVEQRAVTTEDAKVSVRDGQCPSVGIRIVLA